MYVLNDNETKAAPFEIEVSSQKCIYMCVSHFRFTHSTEETHTHIHILRRQKEREKVTNENKATRAAAQKNAIHISDDDDEERFSAVFRQDKLRSSRAITGRHFHIRLVGIYREPDASLRQLTMVAYWVPIQVWVADTRRADSSTEAVRHITLVRLSFYVDKLPLQHRLQIFHEILDPYELVAKFLQATDWTAVPDDGDFKVSSSLGSLQ